MSVLLAVGNEDYARIMRQLLSAYYEVINDDVASRKFLNEKVDIYNPSMVIIQENYLPSDFTTEEERQKEMLNIIENWRIRYNDSIRIVYFCVRDKKDPFIRQLIARNVLDIFNERSISGSGIVEQLRQPAKYSNISKFTSIGAVQFESFNEDVTSSEGSTPNSIETTNKEITTETLDENNILDELDELDEIDGGKESSNEVANAVGIEQTPKKEGKANQFHKNLKDVATKVGTSTSSLTQSTSTLLKGVTDKLPKPINKDQDDDMIQEIFIEDFIELNTDMFAHNTISNTVIGTVLISVASVKSHLGSTHTALALGSFLANKGHAVAVVECTDTQDFDRIHALYVGEKQLLKNENEFVINGVNHYKYRKNTPLNDLYTSFEYVIMDYSELQHAAAYMDEFYRSHVRIVVCSANEWHANWLEQFLLANRVKKDDCLFVAPASSEKKVADFANLVNYNHVYALPQQDNPYELHNQTEKVFSQILGPFIKNESLKMVSKKTVTVAIILSVIVTAALVLIFTTL